MRKVMGFKGFLLIIALIAAVSFGIHLFISSGLREKQDTLNARQVELTRLSDEIQNMRAQIKQMDSADYIVASAMTDYAYMNKDGLRFEFSNPEALYAYTEEEMKIMMDELAD